MASSWDLGPGMRLNSLQWTGSPPTETHRPAQRSPVQSVEADPEKQGWMAGLHAGTWREVTRVSVQWPAAWCWWSEGGAGIAAGGFLSVAVASYDPRSVAE